MDRHIVYLALGSNLGERVSNLNRAIEEIAQCVGTIEAVSSFHTSEPWGFKSDNVFVNGVCRVVTRLEPMEVLDVVQDIEQRMGRVEKSVDGIYHDRVIDIDILLYDDLSLSTPRLTIPHPLMWKRDFVKIPLAEIMI